MDTQHHNYMCRRLSALQLEDKYTDFAIQTEDGDKIQCHKVIMAAASPFFDTMFDNEMMETQSNTVTLHFSTDIVNVVLEYIYKGCYNISSNSKSIPAVYFAANFLQISPLIKLCEEFLETGMEPSISLEIWHISKRFGNDIITAVAKTIADKNFSSFCNADSMGNIDFSGLKTLLLEPFLNCSSTLKCKAGWVWLVVQENVDETLTEDVIRTLVSANNVDTDDIRHACRKHIDELLEECEYDTIIPLQSLWEKSCEKLWIKPMPISNITRNPDVNMDKCFVVVGGDQREENKIAAFSYKKKIWFDLKAKAKDIGHRYAVCSSEDELYLSGGTMSGNQRHFLLFTGYSKEWSNLPDMPIGREQHSMHSVGRCLYVIGGTSREEENLRVVHLFSLNDRKWKKSGEVAYPVSAATSVKLGTKILLLGGSEHGDPRAPSDIAQYYDTETKLSGKLSFTLPFKSKIQTMAAVAVNDEVYLIHKGEVFVLKEKTKAECISKVENAPYKGFAATVFGDKILILGGENDNFKPIESMLQFDVKSRQSVTLPICTPWKIKYFAHTDMGIHQAWDMDRVSEEL